MLVLHALRKRVAGCGKMLRISTLLVMTGMIDLIETGALYCRRKQVGREHLSGDDPRI